MLDPDEDTSKRVCEVCRAPIPYSWQAWCHAVKRKTGRYDRAITCQSEYCKSRIKEIA